MIPKEKAEELIKKMDVIHYIKLHGKNKDSKGLPVSMHDTQVKQCALIAIDEILSEIYSNKCTTTDERRMFWQEVKQEIEKL